MSGLSPEARGIVERGRRGDGPSHSDRERHRRVVLARVGAVSAVATAAGAAKANAAAATGASGASGIAGTGWGAGTLLAKAVVGVGLARQ